jgi:dihydroneopterin aldolase
MGVITVAGIRVYAFHGCLEEETKIGSDYIVDVEIVADLSKSSISDDLKDTIDYVLVNKIVFEEMQIPSKLLEHVAKRIVNRLLETPFNIQAIDVAVSKLNPPINGNVERVTVKEQYKIC